MIIKVTPELVSYLKRYKWRKNSCQASLSLWAKASSSSRKWKIGLLSCAVGVFGCCGVLLLVSKDEDHVYLSDVFDTYHKRIGKLSNLDSSPLRGFEDRHVTSLVLSFLKGNDSVTSLYTAMTPFSGIWDWLFPWEQSKSDDPWVLLNLTRSRNFWIRQMGVASLANKTNWDDYKYRNIAQACSPETVVALARYPQANDKFFLPPPRLHPPEHDILKELRNHITKLPVPESMTSAIQYYRLESLDTQALFQRDPLGMDNVAMFTVPGEDEKKREKAVLTCLEALCAYTTAAPYARIFVKNEGLALLQRLHDEYTEDKTVQMYLATILANLSQSGDLVESVVKTGWVHTLRKWSHDKNAAVSILALTTLSNLDRDWITHDVYQDIMLLHPTQRNSRSAKMDVIFVHGLRGSAVRTWRQRDPMGKDNSEVSQCWPKDWLASDCPNVRIISIGYNTLLHRWGDHCPYEQDKRTIDGRGKELLAKLQRAGVGSRPIVWVGHSMGGLLIKQMLCHSNQTAELSKVVSQTKGVVMYSVPHHGTSVVDVMMYAKYILFPSVEVQELNTTSPKLKTLHDDFSSLVSEKSIPVLSFGEKAKTTMGRPFPKVLVVPLESSDPGFGKFVSLDTNHIDTCKPSNENDMIYLLTLSFITNIMDKLKQK